MAFREVSVVQVKRHCVDGSMARASGPSHGCRRRPQDARALHRRRGRARCRSRRRRGAAHRRADRPDLRAGPPAPTRRSRRGWRSCSHEEQQIKGWVDDGLTVVKISILLRAKASRSLIAPWPASRWSAAGRAAQDDGARRRPAAGDRMPGRLRPSRSHRRRREATSVLGAHLHRLLQPPPVRLADLLPDDRGGDQRLRGRLELLRRGLPRRDPRSDEGDRRRRRQPRATAQRHLLRVRPVAGLRRRRRTHPHDRPTSLVSSASCPMCGRTSSPARTSGTSPTCADGQRPGAQRRPAGASTARPSAARSRSSGPRSCRCSCPHRRVPSTSPSGPTPRCTETSTARWTGRSTACRIGSSAST